MDLIPILCCAKFDQLVEMAALIHYAESCGSSHTSTEIGKIVFPRLRDSSPAPREESRNLEKVI